MLSHRGPEFRAILRRAEEMIQPVLGTRNRVFFFAGSGTGMMEASLVNVLAPGERVLVAVNGYFGERFCDIATALGARVDRLEIPWGRAVEPEAVEERVKSVDYRAVVVVHNESSTGVVADLAGIGAVLRERPALLVVDSVSGLGGVEMRQDEWGVDMVASASQKALMCPPGGGAISMSAKAWEVVKRDDRLPRYYWDFRKAMAEAAKCETPFTTPVSLLMGLHEALEMIHEEGLDNVLARHRRLAAALRAGCEALGLADFPQAATLSSTVVCVTAPKGLTGDEIVRRMKERHGTVITGLRNRLEGRLIRIGAMGHLGGGDILTDLAHLEETLAELGWAVTPGAGLAAAENILREEWHGR